MAKTRRIKVCKNDTTKPELPCQSHETAFSAVQDELDVKCSKLYSELMEAKRKERILADRLNNCIEEKNVLAKENSLLATQVGHLENNACKNCSYSLDNTSKKLIKWDKDNVKERLKN